MPGNQLGTCSSQVAQDLHPTALKGQHREAQEDDQPSSVGPALANAEPGAKRRRPKSDREDRRPMPGSAEPPFGSESAAPGNIGPAQGTKRANAGNAGPEATSKRRASAKKSRTSNRECSSSTRQRRTSTATRSHLGAILELSWSHLGAILGLLYTMRYCKSRYCSTASLATSSDKKKFLNC